MAHPMSLSFVKGLQQEPGAVVDHRQACMFDCLVCRLSIVAGGLQCQREGHPLGQTGSVPAAQHQWMPGSAPASQR